MSDHVTVLPYADDLTRFGVVVDRSGPQTLKIYVPGARWRDQSVWLIVVAVPVAVVCALVAIFVFGGQAAFITSIVMTASTMMLLGIGLSSLTNTALPSVLRKLEFRVSREGLTVIITAPRPSTSPATSSTPGRWNASGGSRATCTGWD